ncbi:FdtA/QdtA family cupin domain-containing protein [Flavobacteriales bacterium]|nr:FdtA/QdtA family cupin domain-containing protein [Flavobacteriales bacterium]
MNGKINDCRTILLPKIHEREKGTLSFIENLENIPFAIKRIFYLYDIPGGESRGAHAHKECHQFLIATSGSFEVQLDDGEVKKTVMLNQPYTGLHIPPRVWASEVNFSSGAICLVLASELYNENDYIRDYKTFINLKSDVSSS